jgi:hypothetical protein
MPEPGPQATGKQVRAWLVKVLEHPDAGEAIIRARATWAEKEGPGTPEAARGKPNARLRQATAQLWRRWGRAVCEAIVSRAKDRAELGDPKAPPHQTDPDPDSDPFLEDGDGDGDGAALRGDLTQEIVARSSYASPGVDNQARLKLKQAGHEALNTCSQGGEEGYGDYMRRRRAEVQDFCGQASIPTLEAYLKILREKTPGFFVHNQAGAPLA